MSKQKTPAPTKPRYDVLVADEYERDGQKQVNWIRVGAAWDHDDGDGFQITLKALPLNGTLVVRRHKPKPE
jgi:serine/threonine protein kinase HipA of HipAB toxin-antitoxin module